MINDPLFDDLREAGWRRKLTDAEEARLRAWLATHPEALPEWEAEAALNEAFGRLPEAIVPSNFTAQVLQALDRETVAASRPRSAAWRLLSRHWLPRAAFGAVVLGAGFFSYRQVRADPLKPLVKSVETVSRVTSLPSAKILEDFDAIRAMSATPAADEELLALMK